MSTWAWAIASWLVEVYLLSTIVLIVAGLALKLLNQPARRLAVARWTLISFGILAPFTAGARVARLQSFDVGPAPAATPPADHSLGSCTCCHPPLRIEPLSPPTVSDAGSTGSSGNWVGSPLALFAVGSFAMVGWLGLGAIASARLTSRTKAAPERIRDILDRIVGDGRRPPRLLVSETASQPIAIGLIRPSIILPAWFAGSEPEARIEAALAHEWAHIRNGDLTMLALGRILLPLLFAHPLFLRLRRRIHDDQEALADADAAALAGCVDYAEALLRWTRTSRSRDSCRWSLSLGLWGRRSSLAERVALILDQDVHVEPRCPRSWGLAVRGATVALIIGLATASVAGVTDPGVGNKPDVVRQPLRSEPRHPLEDISVSSILCCPNEDGSSQILVDSLPRLLPSGGQRDDPLFHSTSCHSR